MQAQDFAPPAHGSPWPTRPQSDLLQTIFGPDERVAESYAAWRSAVDLDVGLDAGSYRLLPLLDYRLRGLGLDDAITGRLRGIYRRSWIDNHLLFARVGELLNRLADAKIETMLLKGAPLALVYYPRPECRPMGDIDVLVHERDASRAERLISDAGWPRMLPRARLERLQMHAVSLSNGAQEIDLHWRGLFETRTAASVRWFWEGAVPFQFGEVGSLRPRTTVLLLSVIVHGLRANPVPPVRWVADAMTILRHEAEAIDWDDLTSFAIRQRLGWRTGLGLDYLRKQFAAPIPAEIPARLLVAGQGIFERAENTIYLPGAIRPGISPLRRWLCRAARKSLRTISMLEYWT